jgi:hypothetical protein
MHNLHPPGNGHEPNRQGAAPDRFHLLNLEPLRDELLIGVAAIAEILYQVANKKTIRATYHVLEFSSSVPSFKLSGRWVVRLSTLKAKWWLQERKAFEGHEEELLAKTAPMKRSP